MSKIIGKNLKLNTVSFRGGCLTGENHSGVELHGFLSYFVNTLKDHKPYKIFGYKGKQVRDNIHSKDLTEAFWYFYKDPINNAVFNIGGGKYSNCSILEAINYLEKKLNIVVTKKILNRPRVGDHKWYVSDINKFQNSYPKFKIKYNTEKIIDQILEENQKSLKIKF